MEDKKEVHIKELLGEDYLKRFKIFYPQTLFEPVWENLREKRCVLCGNKLKFPLRGNIAMCSSNKHFKSFVIKLTTLKKLF